MKQELQVECYCFETTLLSGPIGICTAHTYLLLSAEHLVIPRGWRSTTTSPCRVLISRTRQHRNISHSCGSSPRRRECPTPAGTHEAQPSSQTWQAPAFHPLISFAPGLNQLRVAWVIVLVFLQPMESHCPVTALHKRRWQLRWTAHKLDKKEKGWGRIILQLQYRKDMEINWLAVTQAVCGRDKN